MTTYTFPLIDRRFIAENTMEISLARDASFQFIAGQYVRLGFPTVETNRLTNDTSRLLSILSSPDDMTRLTFAFRLSDSPFKQLISTMPFTMPVMLQGPLGNFTLENTNTRPIIFIAGGIGIAPFLSMIRQHVARNKNQTITLLYANSSIETTAYLSELDELAEYEHFSLQCRIGKIDWEYIQKSFEYTTQHLWYIAGSPRMVNDMQQLLLIQHIAPENIRVESFTGMSQKQIGGCGGNCQCQCGQNTNINVSPSI